MTYQLFSKLFYVLIITFVGLNAIIWFTWTKEITDPKRKGGDLLRIGYIPGKNFVPLATIEDPPPPVSTINATTPILQHVDMVTVGDSFSVGENLAVGSYQNRIKMLFNVSIQNVPNQKELSFYPVKMLTRLINSGYLDQIKPRFLVLETIEREAINRLVYGFNLTDSATIEELLKEQSGRRLSPRDIDSHLKFINNGNWQFVANNIQYRFNEKAINSKVVKSSLQRPLFSSQKGDILFFHKFEIIAANKATPQAMATLNNNLNSLADILKSKGITLIFMPVPDKLSLYEPYLKNRTYPKSIFFDELRKLSKRYEFIDTEQTLSKELSSGVIDLYYQGDTHWSWKACNAIAIAFKYKLAALSDKHHDH